MLSLPVQNISNIGREIIMFNRQNDGTLSIMRDKTFFPYYYTPSAKGIFNGYLGNKYNKVICKEPYQIKDQRNAKIDGESDIVYVRRYLLDKVNITKSRTKWIMFDIETKSKIMPNPQLAPDPITCITTYNNYTENYTTFWCLDYKSEYAMIDAFINYIKANSPDLLIAYNSEGFDAPYLINRFPDFAEKVSPLNRIKKRNGYPEGISIVDYYQLINKVYKYKRRSLDFIYSDEFKVPQNSIKYRFDVIADIIKQKNQDDVRKMVELETKLHLIDYFDEQRRIAKVLWEDLMHYSVSVDGLILQAAKAKGVILPSKPDEEEKIRRNLEDNIEGGYVFALPGRYDNVTLLDVSGTYPSLIVTFNLDPANKRPQANPQTVSVKKVHILQNSNAIVPTVSNQLINSRKAIQQSLETVEGKEYDLLKKRDDAHKSLNNTLYGILLFKNSRIYDKDIADTITYLARFLIRYTSYALYLNKYRVIASDTDSIFVHSKECEAIEKLCNEVIVPKWLNHFGKTSGKIKFKYEGYFENLLFVAKKHYKGNFVTAKGEKKSIDKGIEIVRKDSSKFQEKFVEDLINKILNNETEEQCTKWINEQKVELRKQPIKEISFPFQLTTTDYKSAPIFVRALEYTDELITNFSKEYHTELFYIYVAPFGTAERHSKRLLKNKETGIKALKESHTIVNKNVLAFDENTNDHIKEIDWNEMERKNIIDKVEHIYKPMKWNLDLIKEPKIKKERKKKETK